MLYTTYLSKMKYIPKGKPKLIVMRFVPQGIDISNPSETLIFVSKHLAPSPSLLLDYKEDHDWEKFKVQFKEELKGNPNSKLHLDLIRDRLFKEEDVYIICCEKDYTRCHRSILAEMLQEEGFEWKEFQEE